MLQYLFPQAKKRRKRRHFLVKYLKLTFLFYEKKIILQSKNKNNCYCNYLLFSKKLNFSKLVVNSMSESKQAFVEKTFTRTNATIFVPSSKKKRKRRHFLVKYLKLTLLWNRWLPFHGKNHRHHHHHWL